MADGTLPATKVCTKCREAKPLAAFHSKAGAKGGRCPSCKDCYNSVRRSGYPDRAAAIAAYQRDLRQKNPERFLAYERKRSDERKPSMVEYRKRRRAAMTPEDKRLKNEELKAWKRANPDRVKAMWERTYEKHKAKHFAKSARWVREHPEARAAIMDRRRAAAVGATGSYTADDVRHLLRTQGRVCRYCDCQLTKFHVDHFVPLAGGGSNGPDNLVLSCPTCNFRKGAKMPWDWMPERFPKPPD